MHIDWDLLKRSIKSELSETERILLQEWLDESPRHMAFYEDLKSWESRRADFNLTETDLQSYKNNFKQKLSEVSRQKQRRRMLRLVAYAALWVLPLVVATVLFLLSRSPEEVSLATVRMVLPESHSARLVVHGGEMIYLDSVSMIMADYGGAKIKNIGNTLVYNDTIPVADTVMNSLITPRGGEYTVVLSDGTKVWLNAASELQYPVRFGTDLRKVSLKGEAYFEVAHNAHCPFVVVAEEMEMRVYGTQFNVNTHKDNHVQTTLVEGAVSVKVEGEDEQMLRPGEMADYDREENEMTVGKVNLLHYVAWKNGEYYFVDEPLENILNELALWYDVEPFYKNAAVKKICFSCYIPKYKDIDEILQLLENTSRVTFERKGRTVVVK